MSTSFPCVVTIAGTDPSGGAGIQADIKAISATGSYAASIITALVAQNTLGVQAIQEVPSEFILKQWHSVFSDLEVKAVKIGMLHNEEVIQTVFSELIKRQQNLVVFDPVMVAKGGALLLQTGAVECLKQHMKDALFLITPNLYEAQHLLDASIASETEMSAAAMALGKQFNTNVLVKGGHLDRVQSSDVLFIKEESQCYWFHSERIISKNTHGTGCSLSSAIASYLAQDFTLYNAIAAAKNYVTRAIASGAKNQIGQGFGPIDHFYFLSNRRDDNSF